MLNPIRYFETPFNDERITHMRLANLAGDAINRFKGRNGDSF